MFLSKNIVLNDHMSSLKFQNYNTPYAFLTDEDKDDKAEDDWNDVNNCVEKKYPVRYGTDMWVERMRDQREAERKAKETAHPLVRNNAVSNGKQESSSSDVDVTPPRKPKVQRPSAFSPGKPLFPNNLVRESPVPMDFDEFPITPEEKAITDALYGPSWEDSTHGNDFVEMRGVRCSNGLPAYHLMHTRMWEPLPKTRPNWLLEQDEAEAAAAARPRTPVNRPLSATAQRIADLEAEVKETRAALTIANNEARRLRKKNKRFSSNLLEFNAELDLKFEALPDAEVEDVVFQREVPSTKRKFNPNFPEEADDEMIQIAKYEEYMAKKRARIAKEATHEL